MKTRKMPDRLYVVRETESEGTEWFHPEEDIRDHAAISKTVIVGVYKKVDTVRLKASISIESVSLKTGEKSYGKKT